MSIDKLNGYRLPTRLQPRQTADTWEPLSGPRGARARRRAKRQPEPVTAGMSDLWIAFVSYAGAGTLCFAVVVILLWLMGNFK